MAQGDGGTRDYGRGAGKYVSRRVHINRTLRRTGGREVSQYVLYMAGGQDHDRAVFLEKGVPRRNLFAIDKERLNVDRLRDRRNFAIADRLERVLWNWPDSRPVCAVYCDMCCGLEVSLIRTMLAFGAPAFAKAIVTVNMQRGHDKSSNFVRSLIADQDAGSSYGKHRGKQLMGVLLGMEFDRRIQCGEPETEARSRVSVSEQLMAPEYFTYRSGTALHFDSVTFRASDFALRFITPGGPEAWRALRERHYCKKTRQRLAAQFALRTMQQRGTFPEPRAAR